MSVYHPSRYRERWLTRWARWALAAAVVLLAIVVANVAGAEWEHYRFSQMLEGVSP